MRLGIVIWMLPAAVCYRLRLMRGYQLLIGHNMVSEVSPVRLETDVTKAFSIETVSVAHICLHTFERGVIAILEYRLFTAIFQTILEM